ncbi:hypothetical protein [Haloplanus salilacus]
MSSSDSPYVFRDEVARTDADRDPPTTDGREVVIVDGRAMSYRWYRR